MGIWLLLTFAMFEMQRITDGRDIVETQKQMKQHFSLEELGRYWKPIQLER